MILAANTVRSASSEVVEWVAPRRAQLDLLYLRWELREFGKHPTPVGRSFGWQYILVTRGQPTLLFEGGQSKLRPGHLLVISPSCATGWADDTHELSELLRWNWRTPSRCAECVTPQNSYRQWTAGLRLRQELEQLHLRCQEEIGRADDLIALALKQLRLAIDISIARLAHPVPQRDPIDSRNERKPRRPPLIAVT